MKKKTLIATLTILAVLLFGVSSFATNNIGADAVQGVRNVVGGAENVVSGAASGIAGEVRNVTNGNNSANKNTTGAMTTTNGSQTGNYNAARTATTRTTNATSRTFLGMGATAWGWFIMATLGIITVALVWYYGKQNDVTIHDNDERY